MKQQPAFSSVYYLRYPVTPCVKRDLAIRSLDGKKNFRKKKKGLKGKTTTLHVYHTFLNNFLPLLQDYDQGSIKDIRTGRSFTPPPPKKKKNAQLPPKRYCYHDSK